MYHDYRLNWIIIKWHNQMYRFGESMYNTYKPVHTIHTTKKQWEYIIHVLSITIVVESRNLKACAHFYFSFFFLFFLLFWNCNFKKVKIQSQTRFYCVAKKENYVWFRGICEPANVKPPNIILYAYYLNRSEWFFKSN